MRVEIVLALLYPVIVGLILFGILRWAKRERTRLTQKRPDAKLVDGSVELAQGRLTEGLKLYLLGSMSRFYSVLTHVLMVLVLLAVAALLIVLLYLFFRPLL